MAFSCMSNFFPLGSPFHFRGPAPSLVACLLACFHCLLSPDFHLPYAGTIVQALYIHGEWHGPSKHGLRLITNYLFILPLPLLSSHDDKTPCSSAPANSSSLSIASIVLSIAGSSTPSSLSSSSTFS